MHFTSVSSSLIHFVSSFSCSKHHSSLPLHSSPLFRSCISLSPSLSPLQAILSLLSGHDLFGSSLISISLNCPLFLSFSLSILSLSLSPSLPPSFLFPAQIVIPDSHSITRSGHLLPVPPARYYQAPVSNTFSGLRCTSCWPTGVAGQARIVACS